MQQLEIISQVAVLLGKLSIFYQRYDSVRKGRIAAIKYGMGVAYYKQTMTFYIIYYDALSRIKIHYRLLLHHNVQEKATATE